MPKPNQLTFVAPTEIRTRLERLSEESGRSVAALIRDAVVQYLDPVAPPISPESLWSILRDPAHWQTFKVIAAEMEGPVPATPTTAAQVPDAAPTPTYRHQRPAGVPSRARRAAPVDEEEKPF